MWKQTFLEKDLLIHGTIYPSWIGGLLANVAANPGAGL
jgi:hypothetical protein